MQGEIEKWWEIAAGVVGENRFKFAGRAAQSRQCYFIDFHGGRYENIFNYFKVIFMMTITVRLQRLSFSPILSNSKIHEKLFVKKFVNTPKHSNAVGNFSKPLFDFYFILLYPILSFVFKTFTQDELWKAKL